MKILVTGGTGFVGSVTAKALLDAGHDVRLLVRSEEKAQRVCQSLDMQVSDIALGDVTDKDSVEKAIAGCDAVVHTAAVVATAEKYADMVYRTNVDGTRTVIDSALAAGVEKIIYVSSMSAMFDLDADVITEESKLCPGKNAYGRSKSIADEYVRKLQAEGKPIVTTYPTGVVGRFDPALSEPHFGLKLFVAIFTFTSSTGMQLVNVKDIAKAHVRILENFNGADRFMLGGDYYSWFVLRDVCAKVTGRKLWSVHIPGPMLRFFGHCSDLVSKVTGIELPITAEGMTYATQWVYADSSKTEKELGLTFSSKEETISDVLSWLYETGEISAKKAGKLAS